MSIMPTTESELEGAREHAEWLGAQLAATNDALAKAGEALTAERTRREAAEARVSMLEMTLVESRKLTDPLEALMAREGGPTHPLAANAMPDWFAAHIAALRERAEKAEAALVAVRFACESVGDKVVAKAILDARAMGEQVAARLATAERERVAADEAVEALHIEYEKVHAPALREALRERDEARKEAEDAATEMERAVDIAEKAHASRDAALAALAKLRGAVTVDALVAAAKAEERERCAKVCEEAAAYCDEQVALYEPHEDGAHWHRNQARTHRAQAARIRALR